MSNEATIIHKIPDKFLGRKYRLCYINGNIMYFTDDYKNVYGDSWDSGEYQENAGEPYEYNEELSLEENQEQGRSHIIYIAFKSDCRTSLPYQRGYYNKYSVDEINAGLVPWLLNESAGELLGGAYLDSAIVWLINAKLPWGKIDLDND